MAHSAFCSFLSWGFHGQTGRVGFGQPLRQVRFHGRELRLAGQVGPLVWIVLVIVEFLAAIGITDITPAFGAHGMVASTMRGESGLVPGALGIIQQRHEAHAVKIRHRRQLAEFVERGNRSMKPTGRVVRDSACVIPGGPR